MPVRHYPLKSCLAFAGRLIKKESSMSECEPLAEPGQVSNRNELSSAECLWSRRVVAYR